MDDYTKCVGCGHSLAAHNEMSHTGAIESCSVTGFSSKCSCDEFVAPVSEGDAHRADSKAHQNDANESWERSDTDGFVSQWASGLNSSKSALAATIADRGGWSEFPALFDLDGNWVPAKRIEGQYGMRWMVLDENGRSTGTFLPVHPAKRSTLANKGYTEGTITRPAKADIVGSGKGLSGAMNCSARSVPLTKEHEAPLAIIETDRFGGLEKLPKTCHGCFHDGRGVVEVKRNHRCEDFPILAGAES